MSGQGTEQLIAWLTALLRARAYVDMWSDAHLLLAWQTLGRGASQVLRRQKLPQ
jgi:hypothetical protein